MTFSAPLNNLSVEDGHKADERLGCKNPAQATPRLLPIWVYPVLNILAFGLQLYFTNNEDRLDQDPDRGITYLAPAPYAFIIWAFIYLGEALFCVWQFVPVFRGCFGQPDHRQLDLICDITPAWIMANTWQVAWTYTFVKQFNSPQWLWLSAFTLAGIAVSLSFVHKTIVQSMGCQEMSFMYFPMSLHFGWVSAASLVNLNGWVSLLTPVPALRLVVLFLSLAFGAALSYIVGTSRNAALFSGVIAWAIIAVGVGSFGGSGMKGEIGNAAIAIGVAEIALALGVLIAVVIKNRKGDQDKLQTATGAS